MKRMPGMNNIPDHPVVADLLQNGLPESPPVYCPVCGEECETFYKNNHDSIFACENCVVIEQAEYIF